MWQLVAVGVEKILELLSKEYELFQGAENQVNELKRKLQVLKSFFKDADAKKHTNATVKTYMEQIKEIIYDAEDTIETFVLKIKLGGTSGIKSRVRRLACIIPDRRKIVLEIESITTMISTVIDEMKKLGVAQTVADGRSTAQPLHDRQGEMRQTFSRESESNLLGLEENIKKLVDLIVEEENIQEVSITGMGGVGKTTLARQVFNHEKVKHHFDGLVWVCVSQEFTRKQVWQAILQNLKPKEDEKKISKMTEPKLQDELYQYLGTSKSLVVFDDIWKKEDWDLIKKIFPAGKGSKVLLTSRNKRVAGPSNTKHINFQSECLSEENSWILLQRIAFPKKDESELEDGGKMENMAKQMVKHCSGLPLAIKVLGGLLAEKYTVDDWGRISKGIRSRILERSNTEENNNCSVDYVLSLSFEELPQYLKDCFLYLAHFPEDYTINVGILSYYLAAEEIIPKPRYYNEETFRDVGDSNIEQLVRRNMVISERDTSSSRFETCQLHDMMREICLSKAKEENFLRVVGINSPSPNSQFHSTSRRLVSHDLTTFAEGDLNNPKLRCLLLFVCDNWWRFPCSSFTRLQLLRVLDLRSALFKGGKIPSSIGKLIHLRYLSLYHAKVSHLPSSLRNLKLLIYLNIRLRDGNIFVPNILMEMRELGHLALPRCMHKKTKLELSNLVNLETLENFSTRSSNIKDLHGMVRLRNLTIIVNDEKISKQTLSASVDGLKHLEHLCITDDRSDSMREDGRLVLDCIHLQYLKLDIHIPRVQLHLPTHLTFIAMSGCKLKEDPMLILEKLPHLEVVILGCLSFCGRRMVCSGGGFPKLQDLALIGVENLEEWIVEEGSMPLLHTLHIHECSKLKKFIGGLQFINSLKDLGVDSKWEERMKEGGEDYYKVQHIPSVMFDDKEFKAKGGRFRGESLTEYRFRAIAA